VIQSAMAPQTMWTALVDLHYKLINPVEARILALIEQGYDNNEIAALTHTTSGTVRRHVADLCHRIFDASDIPAEREKLRTWIDPHLVCCIPLVREMIENDRKSA
jgi:hypothetical protein